MAVVKPVAFTATLDTEAAVNRPCQEDLIRKLYQNVNMLGELAVIGSVDAIAVNIPGVPTPVSAVHQLCDGSEITEVTSPLKSSGITTRNVPDIRNRFIRGANAGTNIGNELGGAATVNLAHSHGAQTGIVNFAINGSQGGDHDISDGHRHAITSDLNAAEPLDPAHLKITFYLKIN